MLDKKTYKLLKHISKHPNCTFSEDKTNESTLPFVKRKLHFDNAYELISALNLLHDLNFIETKLLAESENKTYQYYETTIWNPNTDLYSHFFTTPQGLAYVQQRQNRTINFWVPYSLTTLIALLSLILNLLRL